MKTFKIFPLVCLAIFIVSCEKEPLNEIQENAPETMYLQFNSQGETEVIINKALPTLKNSENFSIKDLFNGSDYRLYNSLEELKNDCSELIISSSGRATGSVGYTGHKAYYFGTYLEVEEGEDPEISVGEDLIDIVIRNTSYEIIYQERRLIGDPVFFGIATEEPMDNISFTKVNFEPYGDVIKTINPHFGYCEFHVDTDVDGDGVPDDEDLMPNSNMEETVVIEDCDSSVENIALGDGYMLSDRIDELEAGEYKNHGQYVKATAQYLASLVKEEILSNEEKNLIMKCVGSSSIGK